jgi:VWFA-related protein
MVPVVVRDAHGDAVGNQTQQNFQLFDKGKPQEIARVSVEKTAGAVRETAGKSDVTEGGGRVVAAPERFVALVFDDVHLSAGDLPRVRDAAFKYTESIGPTDRAAVYALSGEVNQDFTDDRDKLRRAVASVRPGIMVRQAGLNDNVQRVLISLGNLKAVVKRLGVAPGQRTVVLVSPGFFTSAALYTDEKVAIIEQAIRSKVIISSLDARGLYTAPRYDAARPAGRRGATLSSMLADSELMVELAAGTGGTVFENSNGFDEGFHRLAASPEYLYLLGFSPQNLKSDGSFHTLKVSLKGAPNVTVTARHGYYAPKRTDDLAETARQEIEAALFSHDELSELPIEMHTQFFKEADQTAKLSVMAHLSLQQFKFHKADGRNRNEVTILSGLFDRNGNYLQGIKKVVEMRLKDETLARLTNGVTVKTTFDVKPGTYLVRLVVRDTEGQSLSATNNAVEIQ